MNDIPLKSFDDAYKVISTLGVGSFGSVVLAKSAASPAAMAAANQGREGTLLKPLHETCANGLVAVKVLNHRAAALADYQRHKEVRFILSVPAHPNLVQVYELFVDLDTLRLHVAMEALNQTLLQLMGARKHLRFSVTTLKSILSQMLNGLRHIHRHQFFHRDLKPENILVIPTVQCYGSKANIPPHRKHDSYIVKIADYGLSRNVHNHAPYTSYVSTRWYRAPEILLRRNLYSCPIDIWAYGAVAVELVNFAPLFAGTTELDQLSRILRVLGCPSLPDVTTISPDTKFFIPLGGFWREAALLAHKLGVHFPYDPGLSMDQVFPTDAYPDLDEVIKACLTWDPQTRPDAESISTYEFFKGTQVYQKPSSALSTLHSCAEPRLDDYFYDDFDDGYERHFMQGPQYHSLKQSIDDLLDDSLGPNYTWGQGDISKDTSGSNLIESDTSFTHAPVQA